VTGGVNVVVVRPVATALWGQRAQGETSLRMSAVLMYAHHIVVFPLHHQIIGESPSSRRPDSPDWHRQARLRCTRY